MLNETIKPIYHVIQRTIYMTSLTENKEQVTEEFFLPRADKIHKGSCKNRVQIICLVTVNKYGDIIANTANECTD